jgi:hypothetical protein
VFPAVLSFQNSPPFDDEPRSVSVADVSITYSGRTYERLQLYLASPSVQAFGGAPPSTPPSGWVEDFHLQLSIMLGTQEKPPAVSCRGFFGKLSDDQDQKLR